jgi:hypothetical protein
MDSCLLIFVGAMRLASSITDPCNTPTYCSITDNKKVCVKHEPASCTTPAPSQTLYTCTKPNGSKYEWDGGHTGPTKFIKGK